jgi:hypothetical protein
MDQGGRAFKAFVAPVLHFPVAAKRGHMEETSGMSTSEEDWSALESNDAPALVDYTLTEKDVKGPYQRSIPEDMMEKDPPFFYNPDLFWDAKGDQSKAKIAPGPNDPVGVVWIDLSKEHYGIDGTPEPSKIGKTESHGCIRLTNWDADELSRLVSPGIPAILER